MTEENDPLTGPGAGGGRAAADQRCACPTYRAHERALTGLHAAQAALIAAFSDGFSLPVTARWIEEAPGGPVDDRPPTEVFRVRVGPAVAVFLALAAADHAWNWLRAVQRDPAAPLVATARWVEYAVSATLMLLLIAMLVGVSDFGALVGLAALNVAMIACGAMVEREGEASRKPWFYMGSALGAVPWIVIVATLAGAASAAPAGAGPPHFVYAIVVLLGCLFFSFALVQYRQFFCGAPPGGAQAAAARAAREYALLSLLSKSSLAWIVFAQTLVD